MTDILQVRAAIQTVVEKAVKPLVDEIIALKARVAALEAPAVLAPESQLTALRVPDAEYGVSPTPCQHLCPSGHVCIRRMTSHTRHICGVQACVDCK